MTAEVSRGSPAFNCLGLSLTTGGIRSCLPSPSDDDDLALLGPSLGASPRRSPLVRLTSGSAATLVHQAKLGTGTPAALQTPPWRTAVGNQTHCVVAGNLHVLPDHASPSRPQISRSHALTPPPHPMADELPSMAAPENAAMRTSTTAVHPDAAGCSRPIGSDRFNIPSVADDEDSVVSQRAWLDRYAEAPKDTDRPRTAPAFACVRAVDKPTAREIDAVVGFEISKQRQLYEADRRQKQVRSMVAGLLLSCPLQTQTVGVYCGQSP